jgi:hypothetical protein
MNNNAAAIRATCFSVELIEAGETVDSEIRQ